MAGFSDAPFAEILAVPAVCVLTAFLSYFSQFVFNTTALDPGPLSRNESVVFNTLLLCLWFSYFRAVTVDPGRFVFEEQVLDADGRWCKKCQAPKPLARTTAGTASDASPRWTTTAPGRATACP
ncbi:hypothetical protein TrVFT333_003558 [Trichoderma virens FT-333]|nr:hypothetical protein TrVFT333_003558 [Trichoderma virens FT-333]